MALCVAVRSVTGRFSQVGRLFTVIDVGLLVTSCAVLSLLPRVSIQSSSVSCAFVMASRRRCRVTSQCSRGLGGGGLGVVPICAKLGVPFVRRCLFFGRRSLGSVTLSGESVFIQRALGMFRFNGLCVVPGKGVCSGLGNTSVKAVGRSPRSVICHRVARNRS